MGYHGAALLLFLPCVVAQGGDLVAPGALTGGGGRGGGGRRSGGWGVVGNWPSGFFIAGSSIKEMNGLYERVERDNTLPHRAIMTWGNCANGFLITNMDTTLGYNGPALGHRPMEWVLIDQHGVERFAHEGGKYLPGAGTDWKHMNSLRRDWEGNDQWNKGRLKPGDRARTHITQADDDGVTLWERRQEGVIVDARLPKRNAEIPNPVTWRRSSDGRLFDVPAFHLERLGGAAPSIGDKDRDAAEGATESAVVDPSRLASEVEAELPWQVVAIMSAKSMSEYIQRYREHETEVNAAKKLHSARTQARRDRSARQDGLLPSADGAVDRSGASHVPNAISSAMAAVEETRATLERRGTGFPAETDFFAAAADSMSQASNAVEVSMDGDFDGIDQEASIDAALAARTATLVRAPEPSLDDAGVMVALMILRGEETRRCSKPADALVAADSALHIIEDFSALAGTSVKARALMLKSLALLDAGRPVAAIRYLEELLACHRDHPRLEYWLLRAHAQARRGAFLPFVNEDGDAATGDGEEHAGAPVLRGACSVGDVVEAVEDIPGFWRRGDLGIIIGLGPASAPIATRMGLVPDDPVVQRLAARLRVSMRNRVAASSHSSAHATAAALDAESEIIGSGRFASVPWRKQDNEGKLYDVQDFRVRVIRAGSSEYAELVLSAAAKADVGSTNAIAPPPSLGRIRNMFEWGSSAAGTPGRDPAVGAEDSREVVDTAREAEDEEATGNEALAQFHYARLGLPVDFADFADGDDALRRAFRQVSRQLHPDKPGGSAEAFQLAVDSHAALLDATARDRYDLGGDMLQAEEGVDEYAGGFGQATGKNGQLNPANGFSIHQGSLLHYAWPRFQGFSLEDEVKRHYFPEDHGFRLFGDPFENKRRHDERKKR